MKNPWQYIGKWPSYINQCIEKIDDLRNQQNCEPAERGVIDKQKFFRIKHEQGSSNWQAAAFYHFSILSGYQTGHLETCVKKVCNPRSHKLLAMIDEGPYEDTSSTFLLKNEQMLAMASTDGDVNIGQDVKRKSPTGSSLTGQEVACASQEVSVLIRASSYDAAEYLVEHTFPFQRSKAQNKDAFSSGDSLLLKPNTIPVEEISINISTELIQQPRTSFRNALSTKQCQQKSVLVHNQATRCNRTKRNRQSPCFSRSNGTNNCRAGVHFDAPTADSK